MSQNTIKSPCEIWERLVRSFITQSPADVDFFADGIDRVHLIRGGMFLPLGENLATAMHLIPRMSVTERMELFPELVRQARAAHGPIGYVRDLIAALPRSWVLAHIEPLVDQHLATEEYDDYWMFLELYEQLDRDLAIRFARRAAAHSDPEIQELGEDHLGRLLGTQLQAESK